ncbi:MAG: hypothetical protein RLZ51_2218, partial [Pseudomonadota bacterium]
MSFKIEAATESHVNTIVFVDSRVSLTESFQSDLSPGARVLVLDSERDGLSQMAAAVQGLGALRGIHVYSHGGPGALLLGSSLLTSRTLQHQADLLAMIGAALSPEGDLLLYGCNVAQGDAGAAFIALLAQLTGADVAASTDLTGNESQGGDWTLEASAGAIEAASLSVNGLVGTLATISGTPGNDSLVGGTNADTLMGLDGNDTLVG